MEYPKADDVSFLFRGIVAPLRDGFQWAISVALRSCTVWITRVLIRVLVVFLVVLVSVVLLSAILSQVTQVDNSPATAVHEISVTAKQWWTSQRVKEILKGILLYTLSMLSTYESLTIRNLVRHRDQLNGVSFTLQACFNVAIDHFGQEPLVVQQNAKMIIQCDGQAFEFLSGSGECEISVYLFREKIHYGIRELTAEIYLARLAAHQEPLNVGSLLRVKSNLQSWGVLSDKMQDCLEFGVQEFAKEPSCVQMNANMAVDCSGLVLKFVSGKGENELNVYDTRDGTIHFRVRSSGLWARSARFFQGNQDHTQINPKKLLQIE